ncbi:MAG TPA: hypothetical protein VGM77_06340 [Gemmatimonadales bacterium]
MPRLRALLAVALFIQGDGGAQLLDALVFHSRPATAINGPRVNNDDHCHSERCDLGAPIATPPPVSPAPSVHRVEAVVFQVAVVLPVDPPRSVPSNAPLGSRAPPLHS